MANIGDRVLALEKTYYRIRGGVVVGVVLITAFLGYVVGVQIPGISEGISGEMPTKIKEYLDKNVEFEKQLNTALEAALIASRAVEASAEEIKASAESAVGVDRKLQALLNKWRAKDNWIQIGHVEANRHNAPAMVTPLEDCSSGDRERGQIRARVDFDEPFTSEPHVVMSLNTLDVSNARTARVRVRVESVDRLGFTYSLYTWCDTTLYEANASWIAILK